jgi:hypothetical protein
MGYGVRLSERFGTCDFRHTDQEYHDMTRPATKAKSFRVNRAMQERHEVENTSSTPSEFLRVEFNTEQREPDTMRGRFCFGTGTLDRCGSVARS